MRSYVVKRFSHLRHSRRRRMESASLLSRESTTLSLTKPQKGHFIGAELSGLIVAGLVFTTETQRARRNRLSFRAQRGIPIFTRESGTVGIPHSVRNDNRLFSVFSVSS